MNQANLQDARKYKMLQKICIKKGNVRVWTFPFGELN